MLIVDLYIIYYIFRKRAIINIEQIIEISATFDITK